MSEDRSGEPSSEAASAPPAAADAGQSDRAHGEIVKVRRRWALALGAVGWLMTVIGPAVSFTTKLRVNSGSGREYQAFFLIVTAVLFLLVWRPLRRLPLWGLALLGVVSILSFVGYGQAKEQWTCETYLDVDGAPLVKGMVMKPRMRARLAQLDPRPSDCDAMERWGGDAYQMWEEEGVRIHFLALFGLYALAWLSLALFVLGGVRRSLASWPGP